MNGDLSGQKNNRQSGRLLVLFLLLGGALAVMCHQAFLPHQVFWANDTALGALQTTAARYPSAFSGYWGNFWWIGGAAPAPPPSISNLLATLMSPETYLRIYVPFTALFLGFSAWFFFRQLRFAPMVCVVAGIGAGLNMHFFSNACWGLGPWTISAGMVFVALGLLVSPYIRQLWIKAALTGLAIGMIVMEGFDTGAIFSVFIGVFIFFYFIISESNKVAGALKGVAVELIVVLCALFISCSTLYTLVGTQIKGRANAGGSPQENQGHWDFTVQWSLPKIESLRAIIPGLFGYRLVDYMTTTNLSSQYWGRIGQDPRIDRLESSDPKTRVAAAQFLGLGQDVQDVLASTSAAEAAARNNVVDQIKGMVQRRHTGSGDFTGVLVCLLAVFGLAASFRRTGSPYSLTERRTIWFWSVAAVISLMASWGRFGFVYALFYHLPYFSNIRNPVKFLHTMNVSLILLSGFGLEALYRSYIQPAGDSAPFLEQIKVWWKRATGFDKGWTIGSLIALAFAAAGFLIMNSSVGDLTQYLEHNGFGEDWAPQIAAFAVHEVGLFLVFFGISALVLIIIMSGAWSGRKVVVAWGVLSAIMICDLARADIPWIRYYDYTFKYSMNPVVDFLRKNPWEHRVVSRLSPIGGYDMGTDADFGRLCHWWLENDYPYNDIEALEVDQAPRMPVMEQSYLGNFNARSAADLSLPAQEWMSTHNQRDLMARWVVECGPASRLWRLTNTKYIFCSADMIDVLNQCVEPPNSFRTVMRLNIVKKPGVIVPEDSGDLTVETNANGSVALLDYTGALPRAKLYSNWKPMDDSATLQTLESAQFDPYKTVLIATNTPVSAAPNTAAPDAGTVAITKYSPKDVVLEADAKTLAVLLYNERIADFWNLWVDGKPESVLRCNYIMRGAFVPPGHHTIEFRYQPPMKYFYATVSALLVAVALGAFVLYDHFIGKAPPLPAPPRDPEPASPAVKSA